MFKQLVLAAALAGFGATSLVQAAPADDARAHFTAIGEGNVAGIAAQYDANTVLAWIGGPLDGVYQSDAKIREVWEKFTKSQGPLKVTVDKLEEASNPKGSTVTANVLFQGKTPIKVRYVLTYREGKLASEIWQIAPALNISTGY